MVAKTAVANEAKRTEENENRVVDTQDVGRVVSGSI